MPQLLQYGGEFRSPYEALKAQACATPDATFLLAPAAAELAYAPDGFAYRYGEALAHIEALRAAYAAAGYGHGACVALLLENRPEFFWHWLALNALGVAIMPINPELRREDLAYQLAVAEPHLAVALPETHALIAKAWGGKARFIAPDDAPPACRRKVTRQTGTLDDPCALLFTSGTTAKPKCCVLSNDYFLRIANWYVAQGGVASMKDGAEIVLTPLPMFHMNALGCTVVGMILNGGAVVPIDRFHARRWWRTVKDSKATVIHYLGVMPAILLRLEREAIDTGHKVRFGFGAGVDPRHQETFEQRFGFPLIEAWAMTETGAGAVTSTAAGPRHVGQRCIGRPAPGMEYRIVDNEGVDVTRGMAGELLVRQEGESRVGFFTEYLKDPATTAEAWAGGWFHTGDVVTEGPDSSLFFVDRKKNIVRRSGENIAVIEVEGVLANLDGITSVAVAPVPDEVRGEEVFALIVPSAMPHDASSATTLAEQIARACAERLAYYKVPGHIAFAPAIPITATQKLQRGTIKTIAVQALGAPGTIDLRAFKANLRQREKAGA